MPATLSFSLKQARRLALAAQGFNGRQPPAAIKAVQLNRLIERLGILQIDSSMRWCVRTTFPCFPVLATIHPTCLIRLPGGIGTD